MHKKIPILAAITVMLSLIAIPSATRVNAINAPAVTDPANIWFPYGPGGAQQGVPLKHVNIVEYGDDVSMLTSFETGALDVTDTGQSGQGVPPASWTNYQNNPDWLITPLEASSIWHGIYFNYESALWATWGCDWTHGNSACGIDVRQAMAHLIDKQRFITDNGVSAVPISDDVPGSIFNALTSVAVATPLAAQCQWDTLYTKYNTKFGSCLSAFNLAPDAGGFALPPTSDQTGPNDFCAAVDHLIRASDTSIDPTTTLGFTRDSSAPLDAFGNHCGISPSSGHFESSSGANPSTSGDSTHHLRFKVRITQPRHALGDHFTDAFNRLVGHGPTALGGDGLTVIDEEVKRSFARVVFVCCQAVNPTEKLWEAYTYGYQANQPAYPTFGQNDSQFASDKCGPSVVPGTTQGVHTTGPGNPNFICIAALDTEVRAAGSTPDLSSFYTHSYAAMNIFGQHEAGIPLYTLGVRTASLRAVANGLDRAGVSYEDFSFFTYAHKGSYAPVDNRFKFNGGGTSDTIRWGATGGDLVGTLGLAPLNLNGGHWVWEVDIINMVYDTLLNLNPVAPGAIYCNLCNSYTQSIDSAGNQHFLVELKPNLHWQDGVPLDAFDVKASLLWQRDQVAFNTVVSINVITPSLLDITETGQSVLNLLDFGTVATNAFILPRHVWECPASGVSAIPGFGSCDPHRYGDVGDIDPGKVDPSFDPMASGAYIGSNEWECISPSNVIGGPCTTSGTQILAAGDGVFLTAYDNTAQSSLPGTGGAPGGFDQWGRNFNPAWGAGSAGSGATARSGSFQEFSWADRFNEAQVTVQDLASVGACSGLTSCVDYAYWHRDAFHPAGDPNLAKVTVEVAIVAARLDETYVAPYGWASGQPNQLANLVPFTP